MSEQFPIGATCNTLHRLDRCPLQKRLDEAIAELTALKAAAEMMAEWLDEHGCTEYSDGRPVTEAYRALTKETTDGA